jgi:nucleoside-diphosphate-sugar epimerase
VALHDQSSEDETRHKLQGVDVIVHLAGRVYAMADPAVDPLREFRKVNVAWTERLARAAWAEGVRRFVYLSSVKVNGESSSVPFAEQDTPNPQDPYGISKWEAERALANVSSETGLETVIVRSPLVYGPGVGGTFLQLLNVLRRKIPLPLARVENRRSLIYNANLVNALVLCAWDARAAGRTYLVSDGEDLSTPDLIRRLALALGSPSHLWPMPLSVLRWLGQVVGREAIIDRLLGSLQVDSSTIRRELNWQPAYSVDQGLAETVSWFNSSTGRAMAV